MLDLCVLGAAVFLTRRMHTCEQFATDSALQCAKTMLGSRTANVRAARPVAENVFLMRAHLRQVRVTLGVYLVVDL